MDRIGTFGLGLLGACANGDATVDCAEEKEDDGKGLEVKEG